MSKNTKKLLQGGSLLCPGPDRSLGLTGLLSSRSEAWTFVFLLAALFWAFEVIPLYATSLMVVLLEILLLGRIAQVS